jgi:hypothetical protein
MSDIEWLEDKWNDGVYNIGERGIPIEQAVVMRGKYNCKFQRNGKYYLIRTAGMDRAAFLNTITILEEPPTLPGLYTWIVYSNDDAKTKKFACCKTSSILEIGTTHNAIAHRVGAKAIHAAGELKIGEGGNYYNFYSGTFMADILNIDPSTGQPKLGKRPRPGRGPDDVIDFFEEKIKTFLPAVLIHNGLIKKSTVPPPTEAELEVYQSMGAVIETFDTQAACYAKAKEGGRRLSRKNRKKRHSVRSKRTKKK